jgi:hypothetical protein
MHTQRPRSVVVTIARFSTSPNPAVMPANAESRLMRYHPKCFQLTLQCRLGGSVFSGTIEHTGLLHGPHCQCLHDAGESGSSSSHNRTLYSGPVYVHTHTSTVIHSNRSQYVGRLHIACPFRPGMDGAEEAASNVPGFCGDLNDQIAAFSGTLDRVRASAAQKLTDRHNELESVHTVAGMRRLVNTSLVTQLELQQCLLRDWFQDPDSQVKPVNQASVKT